MTEPSSSSLPQELINEIVDYIYDDIPTLRNCSVVSYIFYQPTRKGVFRSIYVDEPETVKSLEQTLARNPTLSAHIRSLQIGSFDNDTLSGIVSILPAFSQTRCLILGVDGPLKPIDRIFPSALALLIPVLQLPLLDTLEISGLDPFPSSHLHIARGIKSLTIKTAILSLNTSTEETSYPLSQLESIYLRSVYRSLFINRDSAVGPSPILHAPNLSEVVVTRLNHVTASILQAGSQSIRTLISVNNSYCSRCEALEDLQNLRQMCFVQCRDRDDLQGNAGFNFITETLSSSRTISQSIEEISFAIPSTAVTLHETTHVQLPQFLQKLGSMSRDLADKDQFPSFVGVSIHLFDENGYRPVVNDDAFHSAVAMELPLLSERGMLKTSVSEQFDWRKHIPSL